VPALRRLQAPDICAGNALRIASLLDLAGTKASVVQVRGEAKDYSAADLMKAIPLNSETEAIARRVVWFEPPERAMARRWIMRRPASLILAPGRTGTQKWAAGCRQRCRRDASVPFDTILQPPYLVPASGVYPKG
jgi:hypothetical protein